MKAGSKTSVVVVREGTKKSLSVTLESHDSDSDDDFVTPPPPGDAHYHWMNPASAGNTLTDVWGPSANNLFATGANGIVMRYDGQKWRLTQTPATENLNAIWGTDAKHAFAVGQDGWFQAWEGDMRVREEVEAERVRWIGLSFYQRFDGSDGGSGLAVVSVSPKVSVPLKFLGISHGAWKASFAFSYFHLSNDGLLDGNQVLANPTRESNLTQFHGGVSVFF
jgi:hypothetical protein